MKKDPTTEAEPASRLIDAKIRELDDWRGRTLCLVRALIKQADPDVVEEWKWTRCSGLVSRWTDLHRRNVQKA